MPSNLKLMLSAIVLAIGATVFYFEHQSGADTIKWVAALLAVFMVFAMWVFPETSGGKDGKK